jgi:hypothetical protein
MGVAWPRHAATILCCLPSARPLAVRSKRQNVLSMARYTAEAMARRQHDRALLRAAYELIQDVE